MEIYITNIIEGYGKSRAFSSYEKAKDWILQQYQRTRAGKNGWATQSEVEYYFNNVNGIEDFAYIEVATLDDASDELTINWEAEQ